MERKETLTTKEHFNKYAEMKKGISKVSCLALIRGLYSDIDSLQNKFNEDVNLNNISIHKIDCLYQEVRNLLKNRLILYESCSFIKHILIYDVLGIKPIFKDDILNYKDLWEEWHNLPPKKKRIGSWSGDYILKNRERWVLK